MYIVEQEWYSEPYLNPWWWYVNGSNGDSSHYWCVMMFVSLLFFGVST